LRRDLDRQRISKQHVGPFGGNYPWKGAVTVAYIIAEPCIGTKDTACVDACPVDCIHPKKDTQYEDGRPGFQEVDQLFIDPVECIDCGACVPVCPVSAIFALDDLPEKWHSYIEKNASYVEGGKFQQDKHKTA
jgi:ferredoxin